MDRADTVPVQRELSIQGEMLDRREKMMKHVVTEQAELWQLVAELKGLLALMLPVLCPLLHNVHSSLDSNLSLIPQMEPGLG